ncbi:MAG: hypothetical protein WAU41_12505 [Gaiellaceae bacterium]
MKIDATDRAKEFIAENGGNVYVWSDESGFDHAATEPPETPIEFVSTPADGFTFHQDATIESPDWWKIEFHHLPQPHVTATWDGGQLVPPGIFGRTF